MSVAQIYSTSGKVIGHLVPRKYFLVALVTKLMHTPPPLTILPLAQHQPVDRHIAYQSEERV